MTYLVLETHFSYCVVLDEAGRFLKVANQSLEVGQTVERVVPLTQPARRRRASARILSLSTAIAACLAFVAIMAWSNYFSPFASIYLTINPEVRIEVSRQNTVVELIGLNDDGVSLIDGYDFRGVSLTQATDVLMQRAIDQGFLSNGDTVTLAIDAPEEQWLANTDTALRQSLDSYLSDKVTATVVVKQYGESSEVSPAGSASENSSGSATEEAAQSSNRPSAVHIESAPIDATASAGQDGTS